MPFITLERSLPMFPTTQGTSQAITCHGKPVQVPSGLQVTVLQLGSKAGGYKALCKATYQEQDLFGWIAPGDIYEHPEPAQHLSSFI